MMRSTMKINKSMCISSLCHSVTIQYANNGTEVLYLRKKYEITSLTITASNSIPNFEPKNNGFYFSNRDFKKYPDTAIELDVGIAPIPFSFRIKVADAANGLCGGMVFAT